ATPTDSQGKTDSDKKTDSTPATDKKGDAKENKDSKDTKNKAKPTTSGGITNEDLDEQDKAADDFYSKRKK
ncbi:MAG: hypothetical protein Q4G59_10540, partial [Planctomycetia bacterium]|nr:hypothetical protein [Planctomycetia bacterium]